MEAIPEEFRNVIVCGDSLELMKRLPDNCVDAVLTDPPYGIGFNYGNGVTDPKDGYEAFIKASIAEAERVLKPGGIALFCQSVKRMQETWPWFPPQSRLFIAAKNFVHVSMCDTPFAFDPAFFWQKEGKSNLPDSNRRDYFVSNTANMKDLVSFHKCPKPLDLMTYLVNAFCCEGGTVLDPYMGSGTTALACKLTGRNFVGFEIDPDTARLANERVARSGRPARHQSLLEDF